MGLRNIDPRDFAGQISIKTDFGRIRIFPMFGAKLGVPAFEGAFDAAGSDPEPGSGPDAATLPFGAVEIPSMDPDIHAGAPNGGNGGGAFATPAAAFIPSSTGPHAAGPGVSGAPPFDPWDYSRPAPDGYTLPWAGRENDCGFGQKDGSRVWSSESLA